MLWVRQIWVWVYYLLCSWFLGIFICTWVFNHHQSIVENNFWKWFYCICVDPDHNRLIQLWIIISYTKYMINYHNSITICWVCNLKIFKISWRLHPQTPATFIITEFGSVGNSLLAKPKSISHSNSGSTSYIGGMYLVQNA